MHTDGGLQRIAGFNTDKYKNVNRFHKIGEKISVDVKSRMDKERKRMISYWKINPDTSH